MLEETRDSEQNDTVTMIANEGGSGSTQSGGLGSVEGPFTVTKVGDDESGPFKDDTHESDIVQESSKETRDPPLEQGYATTVKEVSEQPGASEGLSVGELVAKVDDEGGVFPVVEDEEGQQFGLADEASLYSSHSTREGRTMEETELESSQEPQTTLSRAPPSVPVAEIRDPGVLSDTPVGEALSNAGGREASLENGTLASANDAIQSVETPVAKNEGTDGTDSAPHRMQVEDSAQGLTTEEPRVETSEHAASGTGDAPTTASEIAPTPGGDAVPQPVDGKPAGTGTKVSKVKTFVGGFRPKGRSDRKTASAPPKPPQGNGGKGPGCIIF
ncbi:hypothetical protein SCHPADRAFT_904301 [Schizopora paradoxa]|uniref:Uncharacterized protein n=1 Tax=Schizopora paradoxa TaxID=27342 RepID=A0A0H2RN19_9AGAM|nr:hypothetical protein SCHPADRAFT_904301 [Schizopora paradoxa]